MKKLATFVLALAMAAVCAAPAMADNQITQGTSDSCKTNVKFTIDPAYTVTIPSEVKLNKAETATSVTYKSDLTLTASNVRLNQNEKLQVTIADGNNFQLSAGDATLGYTITVDSNPTPVGPKGVVATFKTDTADQTAILHIKADDPEFAGEYTGTLNFTIKLV
mgnify:CR=1 FL=1